VDELNTADEKTASRIYEIKDWIIKHEKDLNNSKTNEQRVKYQIELKNLSEYHTEEPFVKIGKNGRGQNE
jgi:hypothetical protein